MAIASVHFWRPHPGRIEDFLGAASQATKIQERLGGKVRIWQTAFGGQPNALVYVIEHEDWTAFGKFGQQLESDSEWQQLVANFQADPPAELLQSSLITQPPGLR